MEHWLIRKRNYRANKRGFVGMSGTGYQGCNCFRAVHRGIRHQAKAIGLDRFGGYVISFNGGRITNFATGEVIYDITLSDGMIHELYDYSKKSIPEY